MDFERSHRRMNEINLTALIDIVFHLMVFVMLTTTFVVSESMELSLPSGHTKSVTAERVMRIHIGADGVLHGFGEAQRVAVGVRRTGHCGTRWSDGDLGP